MVGLDAQVDYSFLKDQLKENLPTLPEIFDDLSGMLKDPNSSTHAILEVMRADQTLSMKVLRVANSVQYRGERERVSVCDSNFKYLQRDWLETEITFN